MRPTLAPHTFPGFQILMWVNAAANSQHSTNRHLFLKDAVGKQVTTIDAGGEPVTLINVSL